MTHKTLQPAITKYLQCGAYSNELLIFLVVKNEQEVRIFSFVHFSIQFKFSFIIHSFAVKVKRCSYLNSLNIHLNWFEL